jgi:hypothetical protein
MGFQLPPTLPDYSKLIAQLNSSGMQKVNPPIYEILTRLIQAVSQSQEVITTNITNNPPAADGVIVSPTGALDGDGTSGSPLAVRPDNVTVTINGSNQLVASASPQVFKATISLSQAQLNAWGASANKTLLMIPSAGLNTLIVPFDVTVQMTQVASAFLLGQTVQFIYSAAAGSLVASGANPLFGSLTAGITSNAGTATNRITLLESSGTTTFNQTTAANAIVNKDVLGLMSGTAAITNASPTPCTTIIIQYAVFTGVF